MFEIALALVPFFLLLGALLFGRYPGLATIVRVVEWISASSRPRAAKSQPRPQTPRSRAVSGGLLIAFGFAQRPPPLPA